MRDVRASEEEMHTEACIKQKIVVQPLKLVNTSGFSEVSGPLGTEVRSCPAVFDPRNSNIDRNRYELSRNKVYTPSLGEKCVFEPLGFSKLEALSLIPFC